MKVELLEIIGTALGFLYLYWEYRASAWLWAASMAMPLVYVFVYYDAGLYADLGISVYYFLASVYGLICWLERKGNEGDSGESIRISRMPLKFYMPVIVAGVLLFPAIAFVLIRFTDSTVPWADSFTTTLSVIAMWMLAKKYVGQWLVWLVVDVASAALYVYKDLYFTSVLYLVYAVVAVAGYRRWLRIMEHEKTEHI